MNETLAPATLPTAPVPGSGPGAAAGAAATATATAAAAPALPVIFAVAFVHLLNDLMQSVLPAIYPLLKISFGLSFAQVGLITLVYQLTASLLQPWIGLYTDKHPKPYLLPFGMAFTLIGLVMLSQVASFPMLLVSASLVGMGSASFHPEASRVARMASGGRYGFAQSTFQVGGNTGSAFGPLLAAAIVVPRGQAGVAWFSGFAVLAIGVLYAVSRWVVGHRASLAGRKAKPVVVALSRRRVAGALAVLGLLVFSKYVYMASMSSYYTFFLIDKFHLSVAQAQLYLFVFLAAVAVGTFIGGPVGDRIGRRRVIWVSILGVTPFTLLLPYASLFWTAVLSVAIGLVLSSAFSAIVVYAQELVPGKVGMVSGLFFGLMFGVGGIAGAALGQLADATSIGEVFKVCAFTPLLGVLTVLLPDVEKPHR
jgi:FSR family fosmidomycin resistance protein-like MFS transporter